MKNDHTDYIITLILLLCGGLMYLGYDKTFQDKLDARMQMAENRWENAVEKRKEKREEHCVVYAAGWANELGKYYDPDTILAVWRNCKQ